MSVRCQEKPVPKTDARRILQRYRLTQQHMGPAHSYGSNHADRRKHIPRVELEVGARAYRLNDPVSWNSPGNTDSAFEQPTIGL